MIQTVERSCLDIRKMSKLQKLAGLLIILGPEAAAKILKTLEAPELERVSGEMARMPTITPELRASLLQEFSQVASSEAGGIRGGVQFTHAALEKAVGNTKASDILGRVTPSSGTTAAVGKVTHLPPSILANLLKEESPQTIALITSYLGAEKASQLLGLLRPEVRDGVVERLATLGPTAMEIVDVVAQVLCRRIHGKTPEAVSHTGGIKNAAELLNALQKNVSKGILATLEERNAELGQAIRQKMFTFEDIALLDSVSLQRVLREVDTRDLALALKRADEELKRKILNGMSRRAGETVKDEISMMASVKLREIEAAQLRIVDSVRKLEESGEIDLESLRQEAGQN